MLVQVRDDVYGGISVLGSLSIEEKELEFKTLICERFLDGITRKINLECWEVNKRHLRANLEERKHLE